MKPSDFLETLELRCLYAAITADPNDTAFDKQADLTTINVDRAWASTTGSLAVTVADIDTGLDYDHPDLYQNVWINQAEIPSFFTKHLKDTDKDGRISFIDLNSRKNKRWLTDINGNGYIDAGDILHPFAEGGFSDGYDQDSNGYTDDLIGWDFADNDNDPYDYVGHGSHTAGTIAATSDNDTGIAGIAQTSLMVVKIFDDTGTGGTEDQIAAAIKYSADMGARVSNNSWGYTISSYGSYSTYSVTYDAETPTASNTTTYFRPPPGVPGDGGYGDSSDTSEDVIYQAIAYAQEKGQLFVAAAGNDTVNNDYAFLGSYPASYDLENIVSVAAIDNSGALSYFSNYGENTVDLAAPGEDVYSTWIKNSYYVASGTSMATPHVTGTVALMLAKYPKLTYAQLKNDLMSTVNVNNGLYSDLVSSGTLNAGSAVHLAAVQKSQANGTYVVATAATTTGVKTSLFSTTAITTDDKNAVLA